MSVDIIPLIPRKECGNCKFAEPTTPIPPTELLPPTVNRLSKDLSQLTGIESLGERKFLRTCPSQGDIVSSNTSSAYPELFIAHNEVVRQSRLSSQRTDASRRSSLV